MSQMPKWDRETLLTMPLMAPLQPVISKLGAAQFPRLVDYNALLTTDGQHIKVATGHALSFVPPQSGKLPFTAQYEPRCYLKGEVSTRADNWHDLFNALVWLTFPKAKAATNARHYQSLIDMSQDDKTTSSQRGTVRDITTLLDESGVIVPYADADLAQLLRRFQWKELFWQRRAQVRSSMDFYVFGHGLYEKGLQPYIGITGQGLLLPVEQTFFTWPLEQRLQKLDELLSDYLSDPEHCRSGSELSPVPLLGIPGWTEDNEHATYYDNTDYFRSGRQSRAQRKPLRTAPSNVAG